ncbi:hypothetical protein BJ742DRAFT_775063 [Cladochytrium replicatum]|nr:hypothetical protein BJ742DRAFT_775063 [Cladochytrium replicatum]
MRHSYDAMIANGATIELVWKDMEALVGDGLVKVIGVSNMGPSDLKRIPAIALINLLINQMKPLLTSASEIGSQSAMEA